MGVLRFPNAVSEISKFIETYKTLYFNLKGKSNFSHDDAVQVLIEHGLASSSGAIGKEALRRSTRPDRTRDPLYNQHKMYSEVYRMLGWYKPGSQRINFDFTELSEYVYESSEEVSKRLFEECLFGMCFPNFLVENRGGNSLRPFSFLLKLMLQVGGIIHRDEIILCVLNLQNDRESGIIHKQEQLINDVRKSFTILQKELSRLAGKSAHIDPLVTV